MNELCVCITCLAVYVGRWGCCVQDELWRTSRRVTGTLLQHVGGRGWTLNRHTFPFVFSFLYLRLLHLPPNLRSFHPPPHLFLHHLLPLLFLQSPADNFTLTCWSSHNASRSASHSSPLSSWIKPYLLPHWLHNLEGKKSCVWVCLTRREVVFFFLQSALSAVEDTRTPGPPLPADVGSRETIGGAC